jgi:hypothetical protein
MSTTMKGLIKSVESDHDYRGEDRKVVEIELPDGHTVKAFDDTDGISDDMEGEKTELTLMARAAKHEGNWGSDFLDNPYYCLISGRIVNKNLEKGNHRAASVDLGAGEVIVSYDPDLSHSFREGERLDVLADKIILLEHS